MEQCPSGTYSGWGASSCTVCPAGYYCSGGIVQACPTGQYSWEGSTSCSTCESQYYCDYTGIMYPCPAGHMCNEDVNYLSKPRPCQAGYYCHNGNSEVGCPSGTYSLYDANEGISTCTPVPPGYGFTASDHPPIRCAPGFYQDEYFNSNGCQACSVGYECPGDGDSAIMRRCARGKYAPIQGLSTCFDCPEGFYCDSTSSDWP